MAQFAAAGKTQPKKSLAEIAMQYGYVYVAQVAMGANPNHSADSRYAPLGCVDESRILGRVLLRILPGRQTNEEGDVVGGRDFRRIGAVS